MKNRYALNTFGNFILFSLSEFYFWKIFPIYDFFCLAQWGKAIFKVVWNLMHLFFHIQGIFFWRNIFFKVHIFWEGHKNMTKSPYFFWRYKNKKIIWRFCHILAAFSKYMNFNVCVFSVVQYLSNYSWIRIVELIFEICILFQTEKL